MKHIQKIKSVPSNYARNWMILGTIFFAFIAFLSSKEIFNNSYLDLIGLMTFLGLLGFSLTCLNYWINQTEIEISSEEIISKNKLKKKVFRNIKGFKEESYEGKYQSGKKLIFKTEKGFVVIDSNSYLNYFDIVRYARKNFKKLEDKNFKRYDFQQTFILRIFFLFATFLFLGIFIDKQFENIDNLEREIQTIQINLSEAPKIESSSRRSKDYIRIFAEEYPEFKFKISGFRYKACNRSLLNELVKGDKVKIGVKSNDLETKIKKERSPSFGTRHFHWEQISVYQISHENKEYLNLNRVKKLMKNDRNWAWLFLLFGLFSIYMTIRKY